jgi:capsular polysaccharide biosynthesis protein
MIAMPPNTQIAKVNESKYDAGYGDLWYWWRNVRYLMREQMLAGLVVLVVIMAADAVLYHTATRVYKSSAAFVVDQSPFQFAMNPNDAEGGQLLVESIFSSITSFDMREVIAQRLHVAPEKVCIVGLGPRKLSLRSPDEVNITVESVKGSRVATIETSASNAEFAAQAANAVLDEILALNRLGGRLADLNQRIQAEQTEVNQYAQNVTTADATRAQLEQQVLGIDRHEKMGGTLETAPGFADDQAWNDLQKKRIDADSAYSAQLQVSSQGPQLRALAGAKENVDAQIEAYLRNKAVGMRSAYTDAQARVATLKADLQQQMTTLTALQREKTQLANAVGDFKLRRQLGLFDPNANASESGIIVVFDRARAAWKPSSPLGVMYLTAGIGLALFLCPAVMVVRHNMDRAIKYPQQIELASGVPCLAVIPVPDRSSQAKRAYMIDKDTVSGLSFLRNRLLRGDSLGYDNHIVSFMDLGASRPSANSVAQLGWLLATSGKRTLLVDLDCRNPRLATALSAPDGHGLSEWVSSDEPLANFIQKTEVPEMGLLQPGKNISDLDARLARRHLSQELEKLRSSWNYILIYAPSLLENPHLLLAAPGDSPVISLVEYGKATVDDLNEAVTLAESFQLRFAGVILHHFPARKSKGAHSLFGLGPHRYVLGDSGRAS